MPENLKLISTEDLIDEVMERCSPAVFIGTKNEGGLDGGWKSFMRWQGNNATCYGLCHELAFSIMSKEEENDRAC